MYPIPLPRGLRGIRCWHLRLQLICPLGFDRDCLPARPWHVTRAPPRTSRYDDAKDMSFSPAEIPRAWIASGDPLIHAARAVRDLVAKRQRAPWTWVSRLGLSRAISCRVLWVDDFPTNNAFLRSILQEGGLAIDLALDTPEAITRLGQERYAAVITDMGRPSGPTAGLDLLSWKRDRVDRTQIARTFLRRLLSSTQQNNRSRPRCDANGRCVCYAG